MQIYEIMAVREDKDKISVCYDDKLFCFYICINDKVIFESCNFKKAIIKFKKIIDVELSNEELFLNFGNHDC